MFLVVPLVYMLDCKKLMWGCDDSLWAAERLALVHWSPASFLPPAISSEVGALSKGKFDNAHAKYKPRTPLRPTSFICLSPASLLPVTPPLPTLKGPSYCFLLVHSENKYFSLGTQRDLQGMVSGECLTAATSHRLSSC